MQLCPRLHQTPLPGGQGARHDLDGVDADDRDLILPVGVEMRDVMLPARLGEHPNNDPEEAADLRHA